jgi:hypothetical protein
MSPGPIRWLAVLAAVAVGCGAAEARAGDTIADRLRRTGTIEHTHDASIKSVLDYVSYCTGLPAVIDLDAFKQVPGAPAEPYLQEIRIRNTKAIPIHLLLDRSVRQIGGAWVVLNGRIVVVPQRLGVVSPQFPSAPRVLAQTYARLRRPITVTREVRASLDTVLEYLSEMSELSFDLDEAALNCQPGAPAEAGQQEVRLPVLKDTPMHEALGMILGEIGAGWVVEHGRVVVVPGIIGWRGPLPPVRDPAETVRQTIARLRQQVEIKPEEGEDGPEISLGGALDQLSKQTGLVLSIDATAFGSLQVGWSSISFFRIELRQPLRMPLAQMLERITARYGLTYRVSTWGQILIVPAVR